MSRDPNRISPTAIAALILVATVPAFLAWTDQSLSFPLGEQDQGWLGSMLRGEAPPIESSWIAPLVDRLLVRFAPRTHSYLLLETTRRWMGILALLGLVVWVGRTPGWTRASWVALLGLSFLPLRLVCASLLPHAGFLMLFCWGCCLSMGRPWSKTGTAEQCGGGILLGASAFAAPLGWLFLIPIGLRTLLEPRYRWSFEKPFWLGMGLGALPGLLWLIEIGGGVDRDLGLRPETWTLSKAPQLADLSIQSCGWGLLAVVLLGAVAAHRRSGPLHRESVDLFWPAIAALLLGEADGLRASLAAPGVLLLGTIGLEGIGRVFVARKEQLLIPTLVAFGLSYHLFFSGLSPIRDRQAHSREVASLGQLIVTHVPAEAPVCLFRLNPLLGCLEALFPPRTWREVDPDLFLVAEEGDAAIAEVVRRWTVHFPEAREIWLDPKRMGENRAMGGVGEPLKSKIFEVLLSETHIGEHGAEMSRFPIPLIRGKRTPIEAPPEPVN